MKLILIVSNLLTLLVVIAGFFVDYGWQQVLLNPVSGENVTYGEMYGPLSYFKPVFLYATLIFVIVNNVINCVFMGRLKNT